MKSVHPYIVAFSLLACTSCASYLKVGTTQTITPKPSGDYSISAVSPNGKALLASKPLYKGLYLIDLKNGRTRTLTNLQGAGYQPAFSTDGKALAFRSDDFSEKKRTSTIYKLDLGTGDTTALLRNGRTVSPPVVVGQDIAYTVNGKQKAEGFSWNIMGHRVEKTYVLLEDLQPVLWTNGMKQVYKPSGDGSYIWASLSPNRKNILYYVVGKGAFVADLFGKILLSLGDVKTPKWLNNNYIVGTMPRGFGSSTTATDLVAFSVKTGKKTMLTNTANTNERNPYPSLKGRFIAFETAAGSLNLVKINVR